MILVCCNSHWFVLPPGGWWLLCLNSQHGNLQDALRTNPFWPAYCSHCLFDLIHTEKLPTLPLSYSAVKWLECTLMLYPQKQDPEGQLQTFIFRKALLMSGGGGYTVGCIVCCRIQNNLCKVASMDLLCQEALERSQMSSKICKLLLRKTNKKRQITRQEKKESKTQKLPQKITINKLEEWQINQKGTLTTTKGH